MFLTQFDINPARRGAQKLLGSPQAMHAAVLSSFPPDPHPTQPPGRILWRADRDVHATKLFVLSPAEPDMTHLVEQAGWPTLAAWETRPYGPLLDRLQNGQTWAFRLRGNPVKAAINIGKRVGHLTADQQADWLAARSENHGFHVLDRGNGTRQLLVADRDKRSFRRGDHAVTLVTARFEGNLEITDLDAFRLMLVNGLGHAKGYGCGLMTLARRQP